MSARVPRFNFDAAGPIADFARAIDAAGPVADLPFALTPPANQTIDAAPAVLDFGRQAEPAAAPADPMPAPAVTVPNAYTKTHKISGWTRTPAGHSRYIIRPTDDSGDRIVEFMSRGSWGNLPNDDRADINRDRAVLISGAPLPAWAIEWLDTANHRQAERARERFRAAMEDADDAPWRDTGW